VAETVRVRFAPSPTGHLHIGGARTALFNWLFARHHGGAFILRIEDTDTSRSTKEYTESILDTLTWLGLTWDEGPHFQMQRQQAYADHARRLLREGKAYRCRCSAEELAVRREEALRRGEKPKYDGRCRDRESAPEDVPHVVRFKAPTTGTTVVRDLIRGEIVFNNEELDDLVILRSDERPTYNFAVVVDDATMGITHVLRGDDHLANTPRQLTLYEKLGLTPPQFVHLSSILGPDKARLSKRHGAASVLEYRKMGYLPGALVNYLARLGWSHGDQEIFSRDELIELFDLDHVTTAPASFNAEKLLWVNNHHMQASPPRSLAAELPAFLKREGVSEEEVRRAYVREGQWLERVVECLQGRSKTLAEMAGGAASFFHPPAAYDDTAARKFLTPAIVPAFRRLIDELRALPDLEKASIERIFKDTADALHTKLVNVAQPVRVALTGRTVSPGLYEVISLLGTEAVVERLEGAIGFIGAQDGTAP
jgi:glutamyl-tRNA synthetase